MRKNITVLIISLLLISGLYSNEVQRINNNTVINSNQTLLMQIAPYPIWWDNKPNPERN